MTAAKLPTATLTRRRRRCEVAHCNFYTTFDRWAGLNCPKTYLVGLSRPQLSKNLPLLGGAASVEGHRRGCVEAGFRLI